MKKIGIHKLIFGALFCFLSLTTVRADDNGAYSAYAPYSIFGVGDIFNGSTAYNATMGGVGIASRNNRYLNSLNPAAVTARDSLAFMSDFSIYQNNKIIKQGSATSANNLFNINDFIISFPLFNHTAMMVGIKPYSATGYNFSYYESNPQVLAEIGNVKHSYSGQGSMYQLFAAGGINLFKNLNLGVEYIHYIGNFDKTYTQTLSDAAALSIENSSEMILSANTAKFGLQYELAPTNKLKFVVGATYKLNARLNGYINSSLTSGQTSISSTADTLANFSSPLRLADEMGVGVAMVYNKKFRAEFDYTRSDWSNSGFEGQKGFSVNGTSESPIFTSGAAQSFRFGMEYIPRPNDVRYYHNIIAYRAGAYFTRDYYSVNGNPVYARGLTIGVTLPIFQWYNGLTLGFEVGQRGSLKNNMILETYANFSIGLNLFDIWFQQYRYE